MQTIKEYINRLFYLLNNRRTFYVNSFPGNSCYIYPDGRFSADCIGMIKGVINTPDIVYSFQSGRYAQIGAVIGDLGERQIFNQCGDQSTDFRKIPVGAYLEMDSVVGHAGVYVGDFIRSGKTYNTIECTTDFGGGVVASYVNEYGQRMTYKGGYYSGLNWERHGCMMKWLDYKDATEPDYEWKQVWQLMFEGKPVKGWHKVKEKWYFIDDHYRMITGWLKDNDHWYYLNTSGAMVTGWQKIKWKDKESWFYFLPAGQHPEGAMVTGWKKIKWNNKESWFYFDASGVMLTGEQTIGGKKYYFNPDGTLKE